MDRAFVDSVTGNTTCVWKAPAPADLEALFASAGIQLNSITPVDEVAAGDFS